jgi:hypothetical protein
MRKLLECGGRAAALARRMKAAAWLPHSIVLLLATSASALQYGPIDVEKLPSVGDQAVNGYIERRIQLTNVTPDAHDVVLTFVNNGYSSGGLNTTQVVRHVSLQPRAQVEVDVMQRVFGWSADRTLQVRVDGRDYDQPLRLSVPADGYERNNIVLLTRTPPDVDLIRTLKKPPLGDDAIDFSRCSIEPRDWSASWLAYTPYTAIVTTPEDWNELPGAAQLAIQRWVRAGGTLIVRGGALPLPELRIRERDGNLVLAGSGFGNVYFLPSEMKDVPAPWIDRMKNNCRDNSTGRFSGSPMTALPLLDPRAVPVGAMLGLLVLFGATAGPGSLIALARRNRRLWIFWIVPLLAVVSVAVIIVTTITSEGWHRINRTTSLTWLDENSGEAATIGVTGFYSTLPPSGRIRFSGDTYLRGYGSVPSFSQVSADDGQRLMTGWVDSRVSTYFAFRKSEHRRERLPLRQRGSDLAAVNGLGARIEKLWVATEDGAVYSASNVEAGAEARLARMAVPVKPSTDPSQLYDADGWATYVDRLARDPQIVLRPGTYVAILAKSPFADAPLERATEMTSSGAVIGVLRSSGHAS